MSRHTAEGPGWGGVADFATGGNNYFWPAYWSGPIDFSAYVGGAVDLMIEAALHDRQSDAAHLH